jgi:hypothetical protein
MGIHSLFSQIQKHKDSPHNNAKPPVTMKKSTPSNQPSNPRLTFTRSEFISFFSSDQAGNPTPSSEDITDANRTFTVMLHWGTFKEISPGLYEMVPDLVREFPLRVFERFERE